MKKPISFLFFCMLAMSVFALPVSRGELIESINGKGCRLDFYYREYYHEGKTLSNMYCFYYDANEKLDGYIAAEYFVKDIRTGFIESVVRSWINEDITSLEEYIYSELGNKRYGRGKNALTDYIVCKDSDGFKWLCVAGLYKDTDFVYKYIQNPSWLETGEEPFK